MMAAIEVSQLSKRYRDHVALHEVSFSVERGEIFGLLGPNGAGKTTTVECVAGLRAPDGGRIQVLGRDPRRDRAALRQLVGVQLQASRLPGKITVAEALNLYGSFYRRPADQAWLLAAVGLTAQRATRFEQLSGGQQQRLSIALPAVAVAISLALNALYSVLSALGSAREQGLLRRPATTPAHPATLLAAQLLTHLLLTALTLALLVGAVRATARGEAVLSPAVAGRLMGQVRAPAGEALSEREREVLTLIANGATNGEVAATLFISEATVKTHLLHLYARLGVRDRAGAVGEAYRRGLLSA